MQTKLIWQCHWPPLKGEQEWGGGCSHSEHTYLSSAHQRRAATSVSPFSWAQGRCVTCAAPAEAMSPGQYQAARDHHHTRASLVRWARNAFFYSFAGRKVFYLTSYSNNLCSDMGLQFDIHLYTPCMLSLSFKIILQFIHLLRTRYLGLNKDVLPVQHNTLLDAIFHL